MANVNGVVRVGLIGCGGISAAHANGVNKHTDKIRYVALCDIVPEKMAARGTQLNGVDSQYTDSSRRRTRSRQRWCTSRIACAKAAGRCIASRKAGPCLR